MGFQSKLTKLCDHLGENNKPTYAVMAIAAVKGICRPTFTMMDKTENPETKKYTALREGLTEIIAIPAYWACGEIAGKCAHLFVKKDDYLSHAVKNDIKNGITNEKVTKALAYAEHKVSEMKIKSANNLRFVGVCIAALFVIPGLCSVAIKPLMEKVIRPKQANIAPPQPEMNIKQPVAPKKKLQTYPMKTFNSSSQIGMKVGGV